MWSALDSWLHLTFIGKLILNIFIICPLGTLWSHFAEHWKCAQFFTHWVHWSHMAGHIQNVLRMYPLGILGSHNRIYLKCTQHLITGHIGVTCCLSSQCVHNVPSGYLGPCPQCLRRAGCVFLRDDRVVIIFKSRGGATYSSYFQFSMPATFSTFSRSIFSNVHLWSYRLVHPHLHTLLPISFTFTTLYSIPQSCQHSISSLLRHPLWSRSFQSSSIAC